MFFSDYKLSVIRYYDRHRVGRIVKLNAVWKVDYLKINSQVYVVPYDSSSISSNIQTAYLKNISEHFERNKLGMQMSRNSTVESLKLRNGNHRRIFRPYIGYQRKGIQGVSDTTGTASGCNSSKSIINKALSELIEKNELGLMWYGCMAQKINLPKPILDDILDRFRNIDDRVDEIVILNSRIISNLEVIYIFIFSNKKILSSGISANFSLDSAFFSAIKEAELLLTIYKEEEYGNYAGIEGSVEFELLYNHIKNLYVNGEIRECESKAFLDSNNETIKILDDLNDIEVMLMNICRNPFSKTIKVYSEKLNNCIPKRSNLLKSQKLYLYDYFGIDPFQVDVPDCLIV
ncbi:hypothetical protein HPA07_01470 [Streptococcus suis]|uniref:YcaO-like family protein n=1 Tax=Streptococcus suis TaxID=1307 RepID=UPI0005CD9642|nr:YcaO-like family protein [Streptococcus suis]MDY7283299.1 YcaO-like family protein [Streptococcus suis]NQG77209.1 hypothetical protein [Streptococcus suis]NQH59282.1 hypothetical protein [Streptococcus suis]NQN47204.1 hypothetical protein [Streptococcus suis]NQN55237.1 hypothetical protein [Streptococcus suis]